MVGVVLMCEPVLVGLFMSTDSHMKLLLCTFLFM